MASAPDPAEYGDSISAEGRDDSDFAKPAGSPVPAAPALGRWLLVYSLLRIGLLVALAALLSLVMPLILALLFAIVLALPLSWLLFGGVRRRVNEGVAASTAHRRSARERLRAALDGQESR